MAGLLITSLLIGTATAFVLYFSQTKQLETKLMFEIELQTIALESELSRFKNLTTQITSRSSIRQELERYLRGEIDLEALINYSSPKLTDAMQLADDMVGINRLDAKGTPLIQVGDPIPATLWPIEFLADSIQLSMSETVSGRQLLVLSAPIFNRRGIKAGIDIVAFDSHRITEIAQRFIQRRQSQGNVRIAMPTSEGIEYIFHSDKAQDADIERLVNAEVNRTSQEIGKNIYFINKPQAHIVIAHQEISGSNWKYVFFDTTDNLYSPAKIHALFVGIAIGFLTLIGILLTLRLIRPLSGQIFVETDALRRMAHEHKELLSQVQTSEARLQSILDNTTLVIYLKDREGKYLLVNKRFEDLFHISQQEIIGKTDYDVFPKSMADDFRANDLKVLENATALELDEQAPHDDGIHNYISTKFPLYNLAGEIYSVCGISTDITERKQLVQREQVRLNILEMVAQGRSTHDTLDTLVRLVESEMPDTLCSILQIDDSGDHLLVTAAPSFPDFYNDAINGMAIGTGMGSCGTAAFENRTVIIDNIQQHPYWKEFAELATRAGLAACWSEPIHDSQGHVLGTIAMYYLVSRAPKEAEIALVHQMAQLAGIVIERNTNEQALIASEKRFELAMKASNDGLWDWDKPTNSVYYSPRWKSMLGYKADELAPDFSTWEKLVSVDDREETLALINECMSGQRDGFTSRFRLRHKDGHWVHIRSHGILERNDSGHPIRMVGTHVDITNQVIAEQALKNSEQSLRIERDFIDAIVDATGSTIMVLDRNSCVVRFNQAAERITGFTFEEIKGRPIWEFLIPPEIQTECKQMFNALINGAEVKSHENEFLLKNGSRRLFDLHNSLLKDSDGKVNYVVSQGYDITDSRETQRSLADHKDKLESLVTARTAKLEEITAYNRRLFETSPVGLLLCDMDGRLIDINPYYLNIIGYTEAEAKKLTYWDITPRDYASQEQEQLKSLAETGRYGPYEKEYIHKDGRRVPVLLNGLLIKQNNTQYIWSSVEDISERKLMENALRTSESNLALAQEIAHLGSWHLDLIHNKLTWSAETYRIFGLALNAPISVDYFIGCIHPEDVDRVKDAWDRAQLGTSYDIEHRIMVNGKEKWVRGQAKVEFDLHGRAMSSLGIVQDISDLKKIAQATQKALEEAQRLAKVRSEFVANMSHEIRTPLNAVLGLAKMGERGTTADTAPEKTRETFGLISGSGQHLLRLVDDILDFSKIEAGKLILDTRPFRLRDSIDKVTSMIRNQAESKGLSFIIKIDDNIPLWIEGDALRIEQILLNLLSNAVKFTKKGEVRLQVQIAGDDYIQFQVIDTGIGITEIELAQLFKPFEQADTSITRHFGGTGLGLSISHNLAEMMRGNIQVKTCFNVGSQFTLTLPLMPTQPATEPQTHMSPYIGKRLQGIKVLAAEDVELNRMVLRDMLDLEGAGVTFGHDGLEALNLIKQADKNTYDIVLMDIQMPIMDGYEATLEIHKLYPDLPIIGLTAHALSEVRSRCLTVGMVDHITKPVDMDKLVTIIQRHISKKHTASRLSTADMATEADTTHNSDIIIDWPALQQRYKNHDAIIKTLATTFITSYKETPENIRQAIHSKDFAMLDSIAHGMKGSAGYLEAHQLLKLATLAEAQAKQRNADTFITSEKLAVAIERLSDALSKVIN